MIILKLLILILIRMMLTITEVLFKIYLLGNTLISMARFEDAINDYTKAININPRFVKSYSNRGIFFNIY